MNTSTIQTTITYGGATGATGTGAGATQQGGAKKVSSPIWRNYILPWGIMITLIVVVCSLFMVWVWTPGKKAVVETASDIWFEAGPNNENFILQPGGSKTVSGKVWTALDLKAATPTEEPYLFARAVKRGGGWTPIMPLAKLMALDIDVGPGRQGFIEVAMSPDYKKPIRVLVIRNGIAH